MAVDPAAVGAPFGTRRSWTSTDCLLYALGIGAGTSELAFTTDNTAGVEQAVFPTWAAVLATLGPQIFEPVGDFDLADMVHGEQGIELHRPLPPAGEVELRGEITGVWDKGSGAVITSRVTAGDLFTTTSAVFIRGQGGWGGERGPKSSVVVPERDPDHVVGHARVPADPRARLRADHRSRHAGRHQGRPARPGRLPGGGDRGGRRRPPTSGRS